MVLSKMRYWTEINWVLPDFIKKKCVFLKCGRFHSELLNATYFGFVQGDCFFNVVICIQKLVVKLYRLRFIFIFNIPIMLNKFCLVFLSKPIKLLEIIKNTKHKCWPYWKNAQCVCLGFFFSYNFLITLKKSL